MSDSGSTARHSRFSRSNSTTSLSSSIAISLNEKNIAPPFSAFRAVNETDRLICDQGLIRPKTQPNAPGRRIRDKSYYKGQIYLKRREIVNEMQKLEKEVGLLSIDQSMYLPYKKKAESKAMELQNLRKTLADYNFVYDILNRDIELSEAKEILKNLKAENAQENAEIEKLFDATKKQETVVSELETDLSQENYVSEILTAAMNPHLREKYKKLKRLDEKLQSTLMKQEGELANLNDDRAMLESKCSESEYLRKALGLIRKLRQLEDQRDELYSEKMFASASEESEYLQKQVTECNDLLKALIQENRNLKIKIEEARSKLQNTKTETQNLNSERFEKYSKLKRKENIIDEFLHSFGDQHFASLTQQQQLQCNVITLLKYISDKLRYFSSNTKPDTASANNKDDSAIRELKSLYLKLTSDLTEINNMEKQLEEELKLLKDEMALKKKQIPMIPDIGGAKKKFKEKEKNLLNKIKEIEKQKCSWKFILKDLQKRHDSLEEKLNKNKTHVMLSNLEKQWHSLEEENFSMKNFLAFKNSERRYSHVKEEVKTIYSELNKML